MNNFYDFWEQIDLDKKARAFVESLFAEAVPGKRKPAKSSFDKDAPPIFDKGRTQEVGVDSGVSVADRGWGKAYATSNAEPEWDVQPHPVNDLAKRPGFAHLKQEFIKLASILNKTMSQIVNWEGKETNNWIAIDQGEMLDAYGNSFGKLTPNFKDACIAAKRAGHVAFEDDEGAPMQTLGNGVFMVLPQGRYVGNKTELPTSDRDQRRDANQELGSQRSPAHIAQQMRKKRNLASMNRQPIAQTNVSDIKPQIVDAIKRWKQIDNQGINANSNDVQRTRNELLALVNHKRRLMQQPETTWEELEGKLKTQMA